GVYAAMTFATRDRYRHAVERIARGGGRGESEVARAAVALAAAASRDGAAADPRRGHVGYWLVDGGRGELERAQGYRPGARERVHQRVLRHPDAVFVGGIVSGTAAALAAVLWLAGPPARGSLPLALAVALVALLPAADIAVGVVN